MFLKDFVKDYLTFGKRDRVGAIALLFLIAIIYALPRFFKPEPDPNFIKVLPVLVKGVDSLEKNEKNAFKTGKGYVYPPAYNKQRGFIEGELFEFDPNTISLEGWKKLGLNEKTAKTIIKYRSKGGRFYKPEDLTRIWTLPPGFYDHIKNYINCESVTSRLEHNSYSNNNNNNNRVWKKEISIIEINQADTNAFIQLPGIGSRLAQRIINFRNKLGGFYSIDQIAETYGLPDSTFKRIRTYLKSGDDVKKISINESSKEELKAHPYIKWNLANAIIEYRNQHGTFKRLEELKNIVLINDSTFSKIAPYLSL
jgi:competence protein ComEA